MTASALGYASDTSDVEWQLIEPFMPPQPSRGAKRRTDLRSVVDGILYLLQSGCQWGLPPKDFPPKRWIVERTFAWLGINRRQARDFERFAPTSLAFIQTAMIKLMARDSANNEARA